MFRHRRPKTDRHHGADLRVVLSVTTLIIVALCGQNAPRAIISERVAAGLDRPNFVTAPPGDERLFIVEQTGRVKLLVDGSVAATPFLDIDSLVTDVSGYDERGLLGLAFHPDFDITGHFYVNYTDNNSNTVIARYTVSADPDQADHNSAMRLLTLDQPYANHNGGMLGFGADGYLYIGTGDGGSGGDPENRAQDLSSLFGKMLRIDVDGDSPYAIPADNPFVDEPAARDEIWAYGLRNPWRWSFDPQTGDLWIGDVGQNAWEEIDFQPAASAGGENYGWRLMEGTHCYNPPDECDDGSLVHPIAEYAHESGRCSVTGGYVYRGNAIPSLRGDYLFADFCTGEIWSFRREDGSIVDSVDRTSELAPGGGLSIDSPSSFGTDGSGELYIVDRGSSGSGEVYQILPDPGDVEARGRTPAPLQLSRPMPNPFRASTRWQLELVEPTQIEIRLLDLGGRTVRWLLRGTGAAGTQAIRWDGRMSDGTAAPAGVYWLQVRAGDIVARRTVHRLR